MKKNYQAGLVIIFFALIGMSAAQTKTQAGIIELRSGTIIQSNIRDKKDSVKKITVQQRQTQKTVTVTIGPKTLIQSLSACDGKYKEVGQWRLRKGAMVHRLFYFQKTKRAKKIVLLLVGC